LRKKETSGRSLGWSQETIAGNGIRVVVKEDANSPPKVYVQDLATHAESMLLDLNPWLEDLALDESNHQNGERKTAMKC